MLEYTHTHTHIPTHTAHAYYTHTRVVYLCMCMCVCVCMHVYISSYQWFTYVSQEIPLATSCSSPRLGPQIPQVN